MRFTELRQRFTGQWSKWETTDNDPGIDGVPLPSKFATPAGSVVCPKCGAHALADALTCNNCGSALGSPAAETVVSSSASTTPDAPISVSASSSPSSAETLESSVLPHPQTVQSDLSKRTPDFGPRYRVERILGEGGMGTVYKVWDKELERTVALKLVRRDLTHDPNVSERFKQELLLASKVSHRNVLRIHDLCDGPGDTKFISMAYVEGQDLNQLLRKERKLPLDRALNIARQLCEALDAAHAEGVVHRDLKPQNILVDQHDHIYVSDFGLAKSLESDLGMTRTGQFLGTPRYMSPEQAEIGPIDHRSDLYAFGLILCELVTGNLPFEHVESTMQMMYQRVHETPKDPKRLNPDLPEYLARIIQKCLERDVTLRYQSAGEILADLDAGRAPARIHPSWVVGAVTAVLQRPRNAWLVVAAALFVLAVGVAVWKKSTTHSPPPTTTVPAGPQVSLAVLPFRNASGDPSLDWLGSSLADMLSTDVGQSAYLHPIPSDRLRQVLHDLQINPDATSDAATLQRISSMMNADTVVSGQYAKFGDQIRIDVTLRDLKRDRTASFKSQAASEKDLLGAVDQLAQGIRDNLALSPQIVNELKAQSFKPSSSSLEALRLYSEGTELAATGNNLEALKRFEASTKADPEFALAFAKLGQTYANLGHDNEAEQFARKAVALSEKLPPRERYLISANCARIEHDYPKAIESYEKLVAATPADPEVQFGLASLYENTGVLDRARDHYLKALASDPKRVEALVAMGRVELRSNDSQQALDYFTRAFSLAVQLGNDEAKAMALQGTGLAYGQLGKADEALRNFEQALEIRRRLGDKRGIAVTLGAIAPLQEQAGHADLALKNYQEALNLRQQIGDKKGLGETYLDMGALYDDRGRYDDALKCYKEALQVARELEDESTQGLCLNNIGGIYLSRNDYENALTYFQQALELREHSQVPGDIALTLQNLALVAANTGQYDKSLKYYERALDLYRSIGDKRSAAMQSYGMGLLFGYQGRYGAAVNARGEALKSFRELQDRTSWMAEVLSGYGLALADEGRFDEGQKTLEEALVLSRELKIDGSIAEALDYLGDCSFYRGDFKSARTFYDQALPYAVRSKEQDKMWLAQFNLARVALREGRAEEAATNLRKLAAEADTRGLKYPALQASVYLGEALLQKKDYAHARKELERAVPKAEKLELRAVLAQDHYLSGTALRLSGHAAEATSHYREALRYLDEIRKDTGNDGILQRSDLNIIYRESNHWLKG